MSVYTFDELEADYKRNPGRYRAGRRMLVYPAASFLYRHAPDCRISGPGTAICPKCRHVNQYLALICEDCGAVFDG